MSEWRGIIELMSRRDASLLDQIEAGAIGDQPLADTLRKVMVLGGRAGSADMRDWASLELNGYRAGSAIPEYRTVTAPIQIDGFQGNLHYKGQTISAIQLPDFARERYSGGLPFGQGIGEIEAMVRSARSSGESTLRLSDAGAAEVVLYMNSQSNDPFSSIERLYWSVGVVAIEGIVDRVRTSLAILVSEIRATIPNESEIPSSDAADRAVAVMVHGKNNRVMVNSDSPMAIAHADASAQEADTPLWWKTTTAAWTLVIGAATVAAAVLAYLQFIA